MEGATDLVFLTVYGAGTMSTLQSTLDSSQFGGGGPGGGGAPGGGGMGGIIDTTTTDNNSSHDGSEENNDQLPPLASSLSNQGHHHPNQGQPWNLVAPPYTGKSPKSISLLCHCSKDLFGTWSLEYSVQVYKSLPN